jgi:ATP-dependent DNA ligase
MFQFIDLVRGSEPIRDVTQKFPETARVFEKFGLRPSCVDCSIEMAARKVGASFEDLMVAVNKAIYKDRGVTA